MAEKSEKYIVDSSFVLAFLLPDEHSIFADDIFKDFAAGRLQLISTEPLFYEVLNGLKAAVSKNRIKEKLAGELKDLFLNLTIEAQKIDFRLCWILAWQKKLTIYDASYLALSQTSRGKLLSFDSHLEPFSQKDRRSSIKNGKN